MNQAEKRPLKVNFYLMESFYEFKAKAIRHSSENFTMVQMHTFIQPATLFPDSVQEYLFELFITRGEARTVGFGNDGQPLLIWLCYMKKVLHIMLTVPCTLHCRREFLKCSNCYLEKFQVLVVKLLQRYASFAKVKERTLTN